ncbi:ABC transporter permease [Shewanella sp. 202IG2-18]|uniref:ABC transporter permease n=1 Tax=Parashewanella hymeniacidonis TaxID=2807618 RepID=UPI00195F4F61|nr:ABC transporter permease [Parashewanella hymeniacidonis]MBM7073778.1 ABC transporter permease [Parashewanella hymeniacidonis]
MTWYILRRINLFLATSLVMLAVLFYATSLFPVEQSVALSGILNPTAKQQQQIEQSYHLDQNVVVQFYAYSKQRLSGDFGFSVTSQESIAHELATVLPASFELAFIAGILAIAVGVPIGVLASFNQHKTSQNVIMAATLTGYSLPVFWLGLMLAHWFGVQKDWLPISGQINLLYEIKPVTGFVVIDSLLASNKYGTAAFYDALHHLVLPAITLSILPLTVVIRITRSSMMSVMNKTYIRAAEARGLHWWVIIWRHALPNALVPVLKQLGVMLGPFASYAILVEVSFAWPGVGYWLVSGIYQRDYTVIQGGVFVVAILIIFLNILIDVIHTSTNPITKKEFYGTN